MTFLTISLILNLTSIVAGMDMKKILTLVILFIGISGSAQIHFEYLTADEGLSNNRVQSIYRDSRDYLWIGTAYNGLNRYDGNNITIYENIDDEPGSISNNNVHYIYEDSKNNLWIGTSDGLNLYNPKSNSFTVFRNHFEDINIDNSNFVTCIAEDKKGNLWVTYDKGAGLVKWDYKNNNYTGYRVKDQDNDYSANSLTGIQEDAKGNLWVVSQGPGIYRFEPGTGNFIAYNDPDIDFGENPQKIYIDNQDRMWITSFDSGFYSFDPSTGKFKHYGINRGTKGLNSLMVRDIIQQDDKHLLIATDQGGINIYNVESNTYKYIVQDENIEYGLNCNGILCLYKDKEGILWVGTSRGGVNYYNPKEYKFKSFSHNQNNPNSLSYDIVGCFYEDSEGLIWIGTDGGGVNVYNPQTGNFKIYKHDPANPFSISGDVIRCISEDKDRDMWIGTWDAGLNRYDKKTGKFYRYFPDKNDTSSISSNTIWHLLVDQDNNIWLGSFKFGVEVFNKKRGVIKRFIENHNNPGAWSCKNVQFMYEDSQRNIWFCTEGNGISLYSSTKNSMIGYNNFPDNIFHSFCKDKEGKLWAGSLNKGLILFKQDGTIVKTYDKKNGLTDNTVQAIVEDDHGNLWMSTNSGLSHFNQKNGKFRNYYKNDGLPGNTFFEESFLKTKNGEIYFGGYNGFCRFHPDSIKDNDYKPKVYITDFKLFNKSVPFGTKGALLQNHISETKEITLSWRASVFSFEFNAINYTHPEKSQYAYKMENFEKDWNYTDATRRYVTYTNLNPGEYIFRVRASNNDDLWNNEEASIKITILPPWWNTWWFRLLAIFTILYSIFGFFTYRTNQLKKQKSLLTSMVKERTFQLEETNTILEEKQEEIYMQNEELQAQKEALQESNSTLEEQAEEIKNQKNELDQHRNHLERMVKERTADLVAAMKKVEESDRLKSAFLSNMSHEIRTPMNAIVGFSSLLNDPGLSDAEKNLFSTYIKTNSEALLVLIDDILEMSQIQANQLVINKQLVNVTEIIMELLASFELQAKPKGINLIVDDDNLKDALICYVDPIRLKQVFSNLIGNSIKFTEKGFIKFGITSKTNGFITFYVKDTGIGIPLEARDSIFEYFQKVESPKTKLYDGVGLGLSISHSLIKAMGGDIWYESELGKGTTFYFSLPYANDNNNQIGNEPAEDNEIPNLEDKQILVVEDDETNYRLLEYYLTKTKAGLTWAKNGLEALENVKKNNSFDLILMDLKLPLMDGVEATMGIRQIKPDQIIVAQTAFTHEEEKKEFLKCKFNGFIEKPIELQKLLEALDEVFKK